MSFSARGVLALALVLTPALASAQGGQGGATAPTAAPQPPPPGGGTPAPAANANAATGQGGGQGGGAPAVASPTDSKSTGNIGGVTFNDKAPARRTTPVARTTQRAGGPLATFPGFEQLADGGTRFFVELNQSVPVDERRAPGSITYVLHGAHLRVHNDANALVTVHFNTPVFRARLTPQGNDLLFVLELRSAVTPTFKVADSADHKAMLQIDFAKGDFIPGDGTESIPQNAKPVPSIGRRGRGRGAPAQPSQTPNGDDPNGPPP
jgi:hypothetical protein